MTRSEQRQAFVQIGWGHSFGGPNRDRTDDLTDANRTLSQLSYGPILAIFHRKKL